MGMIPEGTVTRLTLDPPGGENLTPRPGDHTVRGSGVTASTAPRGAASSGPPGVSSGSRVRRALPGGEDRRVTLPAGFSPCVESISRSGILLYEPHRRTWGAPGYSGRRTHAGTPLPDQCESKEHTAEDPEPLTPEAPGVAQDSRARAGEDAQTESTATTSGTCFLISRSTPILRVI
jgi:hypothetical protein